MKCELIREFSGKEKRDVPVYHKAARFLLATVLVLSAGAKLADIPEFIRSVMLLGGLPRVLAAGVAALVMILEIGIGVFLFAGQRPKMAMLCGGGLLLGFAAVLTAAVLREAAGTCGCFGALGPHLPYKYQALIDIALAAGTIALADLFPRRGKRTLLVALGLWSALLIIAPAPADGGDRPESSSRAGGRGEAAPRVLLLADFTDFGCQLCLEDFLALCDSLNVRASSGETRVRLIARRDSLRGEDAQARFLTGWAKGNGYGFRVEVDKEGEFAARGVARSSIFVERAGGEVIARASFPLGRERRMEILSLL